MSEQQVGPAPEEQHAESYNESLRLPGGGEMGQMVRTYGWSKTQFGGMRLWTETLLSIVNLVLNSNVPSSLYWGPDLLMIYNDGYRDNIGTRHPHALGEPARNVWADLWPRFGAQLEGVLATGVSVIEEKVDLSLIVDGRVVDSFWNFCLSPVYENGRVAGIYKTQQNVTEQVNAMNALVQSDERLRLALSAVDCLGTWNWMVKSDMMFADEKYALLFGIDPASARNGRPRRDFVRNVHIDDRIALSNALARAMDTGEQYRLEFRVCQADGSVRWVSSKGNCSYSENGEIERLAGITFDITARRGARNEHRETTVELAFDLNSDPGYDDSREGDSSVAEHRKGGSVAAMVETIIRGLVTHKEAVSIRTFGDSASTHIVVTVAKDDLHKVSGLDGQTTEAIRSLLSVAGLKIDHRYSLEVESLSNLDNGSNILVN